MVQEINDDSCWFLSCGKKNKREKKKKKIVEEISQVVKKKKLTGRVVRNTLTFKMISGGMQLISSS